MILDPRPFFARRFHRRMMEDPDPKGTYLTGWLILLSFLGALVVFPFWLVIFVFVLFFAVSLARSD